MRASFYFLQVSALLLLVAWALSQTGQFDMVFGTTRIQGETAFLLLVLFAGLMAILTVHRMWIWIVHFPRTWARYRREIGLIKGHKALSRSMSALAAGDQRLAEIQARRAQKLMPDFATVPTILLATTAQRQGDRVGAQAALQALMKTEARDLGVRGMVQAALKDQQWDHGLGLARAALREAPRVVTMQRLVYDLECQTGDFASAIKRQAYLVKRKVLSKDQAQHDGVILYTALARAAREVGDHRAAMRAARAALSLDPAFVPAACELIDLYRGFGSTRRALRVLHRTFKLAPHPDLIERHEQMSPQVKAAAKRLRYHEQFAALAPDYAPVQLMMARILMNEQMFNQALSALQMAEKLDPRQGVYKAMAQYAELQGDTRRVQDGLERGMRARPDPMWYCTRTGRILSNWQALVLPEHYFGTVAWGTPAEGPIDLRTQAQIASRAERVL